ncbi:MAG: exopolyphosphatase, partial [Acidimicrobiaceae bacterium]|nr:exopolyphosphatase [Acidimicrobiaceae bacterium]
AAARDWGPTVRAPLGRVAGARSGDKGGNANLGVFARSADAFEWLDGFLTTERVRELLPEAAPLRIDRHRLPNIWSLNFVVHGLLGDGVAASDRQDPQAKSLGEWLRARVVDLPETLLEGRADR